jgi:hypothetical protein
LKRALTITVLILLALPGAVLLTIVCAPFWAAFERATGIESIGHSGPASWCFAFTFAVLLVCVFVLTRARGSK